MYTFKPIDNRKSSFNTVDVNYTQNLHSGSNGLYSLHVRKDGNNESGSYYDHLRFSYYLSQSYGNQSWNNYAGPSYTYGYVDSNFPQYRHKFYNSASLLSIPLEYYGETIKRGSFKIVDNTSAKTVTIRDDSYGNLYAVDEHLSRSNS